MRIKNPSSSSNLFVISFLGLLLLVLSQVDLDGMTTAAMDHQKSSAEAFINRSL